MLKGIVPFELAQCLNIPIKKYVSLEELYRFISQFLYKSSEKSSVPPKFASQRSISFLTNTFDLKLELINIRSLVTAFGLVVTKTKIQANSKLTYSGCRGAQN